MLDGNVELLDCGHPASPHSDFTTGYGVTADGKRHCYTCCAARDVADMVETGTATLYLVSRETAPEVGAMGVRREYYVTNWPGSLEFRVGGAVSHSKYGGGFGSQRTDAWFTGPDGKAWHAINRGDNQIARCRRLKVQS